MSFHILHILSHGAVLHKDRGRVVCKVPDQADRVMPLDDLLAVVIAARGVTLTSSFFSAALANDTLILHCDEKYRPCGISTALARTIDPRILQAQARDGSAQINRLWQHILRAKIANQRAVLLWLGAPTGYLDRQLNVGPLDEATAAKRYWQQYFPGIGAKSAVRVTRHAVTAPNVMLNYGYAVAGAICHRAAIVHGLSPIHGLHHSTRYRADALIYDIMEPLRPFVDQMLAIFLQSAPPDRDLMPDWCKHVARQFVALRLKHGTNKVKLLDAVDLYVASLAKCFANNRSTGLWIPHL